MSAAAARAAGIKVHPARSGAGAGRINVRSARPKARSARINVRLLIILAAAVVVLGGGAFAARHIRGEIIKSRALAAGDAAYEQRDWPEAAKQYNRYLNREPNTPHILERYAEALLSIETLDAGAVAGAIDAYRRMHRLQPENVQVLEKLGWLYSATGNSGELLYVGQKLAELNQDPEAVLWQAEARIAQRKTEEARALLDGLIEQLKDGGSETAPAVAKAYVWLGYLAAEGNQTPERVRQCFDAAIEHHPQAVEALIARCRLTRTQAAAAPEADQAEMLAAARRDLEAASAVEGAKPLSMLTLCAEWMALGDLERAAQTLAATERVDPEAVRTQFLETSEWERVRFQHAADLLLARGEIEDAVRQAERMLSPEQPEHALLKADRQRFAALPTAIRIYATAAGERLPQARTCLDEYGRLAPLMADMAPAPEVAALLEATVARAEGQPYRVLTVLAPFAPSAVRDEQNRQAIQWLRADAYRATGQSRRELQAWREYLKLRPGEPSARQSLVRALVRVNDWPGVLGLLPPVREGQLNLLRLEAQMHIAATQPPDRSGPAMEAIRRDLEALRAQRPDDVAVRRAQATATALQGRNEDAIAELRRAIAECEDADGSIAVQLAGMLLREERAAEAVEACRSACKNAPQRAENWLAMSEALLAGQGEERIGQAAEALNKGLDQISDVQEKRQVELALARLEFVHAKKPEAARARLEGLAKGQPGDVEVRTFLLSLPEISADAERSQTLIDQIKETEGEAGVQWRLQQAALWLRQGDWRPRLAEIEKLLARCIDADPAWGAPALLLGGMLEQRGDNAGAEAAYRRCLAAAEGRALEVADRLLTLLERTGRYAEATQLLKEIQIDPQQAAARRLTSAIRSGELERAIEELELRAAADPKDAASRLLLARLVYQQRKDFDAALKWLDQVDAQDDGTRLAVLAVRAALLRAEERPDDALQLLSDSLTEHPTADGYLLRGAFLVANQQYDQAEQDFVKVAELAQGSHGYANLGQLYFGLGRVPEAVDAWERGLAQYPEDADLTRRLIAGLLQPGPAQDLERSRKLLEQRLAAAPDDADLLAMQAGLLLNGEAERAEKLLERVVQLQPGHLAAHVGLLQLAWRAGDMTRVRDLAIRGLASLPDSPPLLLARADAERRLGEPATARNLVQQVLSERPGEGGAIEMLTEMALDDAAGAGGRGDREIERSRDPAAGGAAGRGTEALKEALATVQAAIRRSEEAGGGAADASGANAAPAAAATNAVLGGPATPESLRLCESRLLHALGRTGEAIRALAGFCEQSPQACSARALLELAALREAAGDGAAGETYAAAFARLGDEHVEVAQFTAYLAARQRGAELIGLADAYLAAFPQRRELLTQMAGTLSMLGVRPGYAQAAACLEKSRELCEAALRLKADDLPLRLRHAQIVYVQGDKSGARELYRAILAEHPDELEALNNLAWLTYEQASGRSDYEEALGLARRGIELDPQQAHLRDTRAEILLKLGRLDEARRDFERCAELWPANDPQRAQALLKLARLCRGQEDLGAMRRYGAEAMRISEARSGALGEAEQAELRELLRQERATADGRR